MRYAQGGGLTDERRRFRQGVRMAAARRFAEGAPSSVIAKELSVTVRSVQRWRRAWLRGGSNAVSSRGSSSQCRLAEAQLVCLERELAKGSIAHGWPDQCWTLSRIAELIQRRFRVRYTLPGVRVLLLRRGFSYRPCRRGDASGPLCGWVR